MKVCKFGGSSVANGEQIRKVMGVVAADPARRLVVVSAPGKRFANDDKVTDLLIACGKRVLAGGDAAADAEKVVGRFEEIARTFELEDALVEEVRRDLLRRLAQDTSHEGRYMDCIKAAGEDFAARFVAAAFNKCGLSAVYVNPAEAGMLLSDEFGCARLLPEAYEKLRANLSGRKEIVIFPGFFGCTCSGDIATFPRGGSDITGAILAAALKADVYENFTDVDNVYPVDPRLVPEVSEGIAEMTYREMRELSYAGFGVFHDEAVQPAIEANIPINIRNTNNPDSPGTMVLVKRTVRPGRILGIASDAGFCTVYVSKYLMNREVGFGRRLLQIFEEKNLSFEHAPSGIDNMSVILRESVFDKEVRDEVIDCIRKKLAVDQVSFESGLAVIMVVGEGMRYTVGVATRITGALARAGVNIEMINQGSSEISVMLGVRAEKRQQAVRALYDEFFAKHEA